VSLRLTSSDPLWQGVDIQLMTGKELQETTTEIRVRTRANGNAAGNCLVFKIQPDEGIDIELFAKKPGYGRTFEPKHLSFDYSEEGRMPDAYEQVLVDAISSNKSLFTTNQEVLRSWQILAPVQEAWRASSQSINIYPKGADTRDIIGY
jgi:glucose-6-phosphate 1-dehydrogenase